MAVVGNEIVYMKSGTPERASEQDDRLMNVRAAFFGNLEPPIVVDGQQIVPTPMSDVPPEFLDLVPPEWQAPLNSGDAFFDSISGTVQAPANVSQGELNRKMRRRYDRMMPITERNLRQVFKYMGRTIDAEGPGGN